jgi:uncharacterized membrane protein YsdA (DUF1294 family)
MNNDQILLSYAFIITIIMLLMMYIDKQQAILHQRRIPKSSLWLVALLGGSFGLLLGMSLFHHKTKKLHFKIGAFILTISYTWLLIALLASF